MLYQLKQSSVHAYSLSKSENYFKQEMFLIFMFVLAPRKVIRENLGFRIPWCGPRIPDTGFMILPQWIPDFKRSVF